jgi:hypothetical protein
MPRSRPQPECRRVSTLDQNTIRQLDGEQLVDTGRNCHHVATHGTNGLKLERAGFTRGRRKAAR